MAEVHDAVNENLYHAVTPQRLYDAVVEQIEALIVAERLNAGDAMPSERRLSELFGVSRSVIREAMRILERAGLVAIRPGRGAFVLKPSVDTVSKPLSLLIRMQRGTIYDCLEFRRHLEPQIARIAASRRRPEDIATMQAALEGMEAAAHEPERFINYDQAFHSALAQATGNPVFLTVLDSTLDLMHEIRQKTMYRSGSFVRDRKEHYAIFERVEQGDPPGAEAAMIIHLESVAQQLQAADAEEDRP